MGPVSSRGRAPPSYASVRSIALRVTFKSLAPSSTVTSGLAGDLLLGLLKTCHKLGLSFFAYLGPAQDLFLIERRHYQPDTAFPLQRSFCVRF